MRGYKGMTKDMTCRGMQFEVGKSYHIDGEIQLCRRGFHFCENLRDVFNYYDRDNDSRYFEIEANGLIATGGNKCVTSEIMILRELSAAEINRCAYGYGDGNDDGYGYGYGDGYGYGNGYGDGYGYGYGNIQKILIFK